MAKTRKIHRYNVVIEVEASSQKKADGAINSIGRSGMFNLISVHYEGLEEVDYDLIRKAGGEIKLDRMSPSERASALAKAAKKS